MEERLKLRLRDEKSGKVLVPETSPRQVINDDGKNLDETRGFVNIDVEYPKMDGSYYTAFEAHAIIDEKLRKYGLIIYFKKDENNVTIEQYLNKDLSSWLIDDSWSIIAEGSAGFIPFARFAATIPQVASSNHKSTDKGCSVIYDYNKNTFVLSVVEDQTETFFNNWIDASQFGAKYTKDGWIPFVNKLYISTEDDKVYIYKRNSLQGIKTVEDESLRIDVDDLQKQIDEMSVKSILNANILLSEVGSMTFAEMLRRLKSEGYDDGTTIPAGCIVTYIDSDSKKWKSVQYLDKDSIAFDDVKNWQSFGGSTVGNCYNVTAERKSNGESLPTSPETYDTKQTAIEYAIKKNAVSIGVEITFAASKTAWRSFKYVGLDESVEAYSNLDNWIDDAGLSAGDEPFVNISELCKDISLSTTYTLEEAIVALGKLNESKGVNYVKAGMVMTYRISPTEWQTKQLVGGAVDYTSVDAWVDFGSGGSKVVTSELPAKKGEDAFSTGGAYNRLITDFTEEVSEDGQTKTYKAVNAAGEQIGSEITIPLGGGGGGSSVVSSFRVVFENNPVYSAAGGKIIARFAARSYNQEGEEIVYRNITQVDVLDATTGLLIDSQKYIGESSSTSLSDYKFSIDFTKFFEGAGTREFIVKVYDQEGNVRSQNIVVIAVDVTVEITRALNECRLIKGKGETQLDNFYRFEKNALKRDGGIDVTIELLWEGKWRTLGEANVTDTFSKSITINPSNVFGGGELMEHGSYLLRIHGYAPTAKVQGNYVYTTLMCFDSSKSNIPLVAIRYDARDYNEEFNGKVRLYDNVNLIVAAYTGDSVSGNTEVKVYAGDKVISTFNAASSQIYSIKYQVQGYSEGEKVDIKAVGEYKEQTGDSPTISVVVNGSAIDVVLKDGTAFGYDFALRTNSDSDKTITDNGITMKVNGANWSSNGFGHYLGENCLRVAENVTAEIPYRPFNQPNAETSGLAIQFAFATNNIKENDAFLMRSYDPSTGTGFYVKGNVAGIYCTKGIAQREERKFRCGEKITMGVVVEPSSIFRERAGVKYSNIKMYLNGEEVACIGYVPEQNAITQSQPITFDGTDGDFYLYYIMAYQSHYGWQQAFNNYLAKLTNVEAMIVEYGNEDVLNDFGAPSLDKMKAKKMPYYVVVDTKEKFDQFDGDVNTSTKFSTTLFYFNPEYPCLSFKAKNVQWRRQGTTSAKRPIKNDRFYLNKPVNKKEPVVMELLYPDDSTELGRKAIELCKQNYTLVRPDAIPVQIITVKVDYSDSSNANDCGVCDMMNYTFKALGKDYITPAQRAYDGTFTKGDLSIMGCVMDHSTKNHPIAAFRATNESLSDVWFHAKGNWKEDKKEQVALGFKNTPGYNKGCKNYGDFIEYFGKKGESIDELEARFKLEPDLDQSALYLLSLYCSRNYRFMKYEDGQWKKQSGSMKQVDGRWVVLGTVLNPVTGFELLSYQGFCWWQGVGSVEEMMEMVPEKSKWVKKLVDGGDVSAETFPKWTTFFECLIDDDQLAIDFALGKKVPYDLYRMLKFCHDCDYASVDERIWKTKWQNDLWQYASPQSLYAYTLFTDYLAATDQRAKNMQPMWFLDDGGSVIDGVYNSDNSVRMYLNKVYDCDTCNGKDNDGGCTVDAECDPNKPSDEFYTNPYAGWGSVLFNNVNLQQTAYTDGSHTSDKQLSLRTVAATIRTAKTDVDGHEIVPFSPEGAQYFFVEKRLKFWQKLISSYDGEHKYIEPVSKSDAIYFYALQGLGLTALPQFIEQRWRIRDGYYQTGDFFSGVLSGRASCSSRTAKITIKAAKTGFFGIGHDSSGSLDESVFLEEGQKHSFTKFSHTEGTLLYLYQTDRLSEIDLSEISLDSNFNFSVMTLVEKIVIGSETHKDVSIGSYTPIGAVMLGNLPFLRELDLRNTTCTSVDASGCPRIEKILAKGSKLMSCALAETSPITTLQLTATMTELKFINLPNLSYPGGLTLEGMENVSKLMVSGCDKMDSMELINGILESSSLKAIGLRNVNITASVAILRQLKATHAYGLDENGNDISSDKDTYGNGIKCSGITGRWILNELVGDSELNELQEYFPVLTLHNSQYSVVMFDDTAELTDNVSNMDNKTGYAFSNEFQKSGHFLAYEEKSHAYKCSFDSRKNEMHCKQISDKDYTQMADGSSYDPTDTSGEGFDVMKHLPKFWYKGVNDFKNQKKYYIVNHNGDGPQPLSTAKKVNRKKLSKILVKAFSCIYTNELVPGGDYSIVENPNMSVYAIDVEGMKQVRWPGINNAIMGAVFVDANNKVVKTFNMSVSHALFDFSVGDYIFTDVPIGAKRLVFTSPKGFDDEEAIAVDSTSIEAIEPDWVLAKERLVGVYGMSVDSLMRPRSISGVRTRMGDNTSRTNEDWKYDSEGNPTNSSVPISEMHYTCQDFMNLCQIRGKGFQCIDYEMSKDIANIVMALYGERDIQALCGMGCGSGYTTGDNKFNTFGNVTRKYSGSNIGNIIFGIQNFVACNYEWMDNIAFNVSSFASFKANKRVSSQEDKTDYKWRVFDPATKKERVVQGLGDMFSGSCVARVKFGRYCDIFASRVSSDKSKFNQYYADSQTFNSGTGRVVGRSNNSASSYGGLAYLGSNNVSSYASSYSSSRLTFSGKIVIEK